MKRLHVNLKVKQLDESVRFYSTLFDAAPTLLKPDYAKWMLEDPRVNFAIVAAPGAGDGLGVEHLGIQAESEQELAELRRRIGSMQGEVFDQGQTTCCYHASDKTWISDGQGVSWEAFHTTGEAPALQDTAPAAGEACCEASCCT